MCIPQKLFCWKWEIWQRAEWKRKEMWASQILLYRLCNCQLFHFLCWLRIVYVWECSLLLLHPPTQRLMRKDHRMQITDSDEGWCVMWVGVGLDEECLPSLLAVRCFKGQSWGESKVTSARKDYSNSATKFVSNVSHRNSK